MESVIQNKFDSWISGLSAEEARIAVFKHIRDIPYAIVPELRDPLRGPSGLLSLGKGSCQPKHYLMALLFEKLNIPVKLVTYQFHWVNSDINYPDDLRSIVKALPAAYHLACKALINNKWVLVDATYDLALKKASFPVNESWDGHSDTVNAVTPEAEIIHNGPQERVEYEALRRAEYSDKEKAAYAEFIEKFNLWLEIVRSS